MSSSLKIKIPARSDPMRSSAEVTPTMSTTRRKPTKRAVVESEDEDDYGDDLPRSASSRHVSQPPTKRPRRTSIADLDAEDMDVDVETEFASTAADDARLEPIRASSSQRKEKEKNKVVVPATQSRRESMPRRKAKRHVVLSDDDDGAKEEQSDEDYVGDDGPPRERRVAREAYVEPGDDDFEPEPRRNAATKTKVPKGGVLKGKGRAAAAKEKDKVDRPIKIKDERRVGATGAKAKDGEQNGASSELKKRSRPDDATPPETTVDVDSLPSGPSEGSLAPAPEPPTKESAPLPSFKKKQKFPTIRKNKPALGGSVGDPPGQAAKGRSDVGADGKADDGVLTKKQPKAPAKVEVDLMNKSVYDSLFKGVGGSTPRSGVSHKDKEDRRKQLDKMREDDRVRRAALSGPAFDLRAQHDKILNFEEQMIARKGRALWPNVLAVAFRADWEMEKHRQKQMEDRAKAERERENGEVVE